jgi:hypothetical protein
VLPWWMAGELDIKAFYKKINTFLGSIDVFPFQWIISFLLALF